MKRNITLSLLIFLASPCIFACCFLQLCDQGVDENNSNIKEMTDVMSVVSWEYGRFLIERGCLGLFGAGLESPMNIITSGYTIYFKLTTSLSGVLRN